MKAKTIETRITRRGKEIPLFVDVYFERYSPPTMEDPGESGGCYIEEARRVDNGKKIELTNKEHEELCQWFNALEDVA